MPLSPLFLAHDQNYVKLNCILGGSSITVRNIDDIHEEELDECESKDTIIGDHYSQEYLYVKMTSKLSNSKASFSQNAAIQRRLRWPTLDDLRQGHLQSC